MTFKDLKTFVVCKVFLRQRLKEWVNIFHMMYQCAAAQVRARLAIALINTHTAGKRVSYRTGTHIMCRKTRQYNVMTLQH